jgi:phosphate transport system protein
MIRFDNHAFKGLDESLKNLFGGLNAMGEHIGELVALLPRGLDVADPGMFDAAKVIDRKINEGEREIDQLVARTINKFTTGGEDLRFIIGSIKIAGALERAADKLKNCAKRLSRRSHPLDATVKEELGRAIGAVGSMMPLALKQVLDYRPEVTQELLGLGATVQKSYRLILLHLHQRKSAASANDDTHLLLVAKNLEQTADLAIEIMKASHYIHFAAKYEKDKDAAA